MRPRGKLFLEPFQLGAVVEAVRQDGSAALLGCQIRHQVAVGQRLEAGSPTRIGTKETEAEAAASG